MVHELLFLQLVGDQQKKQEHPLPLFPCSAYYTNWCFGGIEGVPWHWHQELEFMILIKGQVQVQFAEQTIDLQEGDGFFCNTRSLHRITMKNCQVCCVNSLVFDARLISGGPGTVFDEKYIYPLLSARTFSGLALHQSDPVHREVLSHIKAAHAGCKGEETGYEYDVRYHLAKALLLIWKENQKHLSLTPRETSKMERIRRMLDYIHMHYASPITVSDLSAAASICERECQRCFQKFLRQSPMDYVQQYRIQMAGKLLMETQDSVLDVGLATGFSNPSHFCKVFRTHMHCSPAEFRKAYQKKASCAVNSAKTTALQQITKGGDVTKSPPV